jgi:hypothetical protein
MHVVIIANSFFFWASQLLAMDLSSLLKIYQELKDPIISLDD